MQIVSPAFKNNENIPSIYTCEGKNISPPLKILDIPSGAKSLVLIMDDPDAIKPAGKVWDHWIIFNIPTFVTTIAEGQEPSGVPGKGTSGNLHYQGPCPPDGEHRYFFKLYALNTMLTLPEGATKKEIEKSLPGHLLAESVLIGKYNKLKNRES